MQTLGVFTVFVFAAELLVMLIMDIASISGPFSKVIDATILTVLVVPVLIYLVYKPLAKETAFQQRAKDELKISHDILHTVLESQDAIVYVADLKTNEILFLNKFAKEVFGSNVDNICWQDQNQKQNLTDEPFSNDQLVSEEGKIKGMHAYEVHYKGNKRWYNIRARAINWIDDRLARLEIATDITARKQSEEEMKVLKGIVPICSHCKKIRDDTGFWNQVDEYVSKHTGAHFSHSICPTCMKENFPEYEE